MSTTTRNDQDLYFELMADMGHTKHIGGQSATEAVCLALHPGPDDLVLDIGCGVGIGPVALARRYGCRVVGLDITPRMLERAQELALRKGVADRTEFRLGDMHALPFAGDCFDGVMTESVLVFSDEITAVLGEMLRVTRPGGTMAITEALWRQVPPPQMAAALARAAGLPAGLPTHEGWLALLREAGLEEVQGEQFAVSGRSEARDQYGRIGLTGYLRTFGRFFGVLANPRYRSIYREALGAARVPDYFQYIGYGVYSGTKAAGETAVG